MRDGGLELKASSLGLRAWLYAAMGAIHTHVHACIQIQLCLHVLCQCLSVCLFVGRPVGLFVCESGTCMLYICACM